MWSGFIGTVPSQNAFIDRLALAFIKQCKVRRRYCKRALKASVLLQACGPCQVSQEPLLSHQTITTSFCQISFPLLSLINRQIIGMASSHCFAWVKCLKWIYPVSAKNTLRIMRVADVQGACSKKCIELACQALYWGHLAVPAASTKGPTQLALLAMHATLLPWLRGWGGGRVKW